MRARAFVPSLVVVLALFVVAMAAEAGKPPEAPKPGPEHKRLAYFVGSWKSEGEMKESPFGPAGKFSGTETCEWFPGGFALVCHSTGKDPMGEAKGLSIMSYDLEEKHYVYYGVTSRGEAETSTGTLAGDTWTWTGEGTVQGKPIQGRYVIKETPPDSYTFHMEISESGGPFTALGDGKAARVHAASRTEAKPK